MNHDEVQRHIATFLHSNPEFTEHALRKKENQGENKGGGVNVGGSGILGGGSSVSGVRGGMGKGGGTGAGLVRPVSPGRPVIASVNSGSGAASNNEKTNTSPLGGKGSFNNQQQRQNNNNNQQQLAVGLVLAKTTNYQNCGPSPRNRGLPFGGGRAPSPRNNPGGIHNRAPSPASRNSNNTNRNTFGNTGGNRPGGPAINRNPSAVNF